MHECFWVLNDIFNKMPWVERDNGAYQSFIYMQLDSQHYMFLFFFHRFIATTHLCKKVASYYSSFGAYCIRQNEETTIWPYRWPIPASVQRFFSTGISQVTASYWKVLITPMCRDFTARLSGLDRCNAARPNLSCISVPDTLFSKNKWNA